jgi:dTDP-glucose 4,6-dehydratase
MTNPFILVTGGAGFIGSNLVHLICKEDHFNVINLDKLTYAGNLESLKNLQSTSNYQFIQGDIADKRLVQSIFEKYHPVGVFNLAAESHVDRSIVDATDFLQTNVVGTYHLLEVAYSFWRNLPEQEKNSFRFVHISTDEVYGSLGSAGKFTESSPMQPNSPYAASKASADHFIRAFFHTFGLPVITTNCSNNYGPYQFPEKLIPLVIQQAIHGKYIPVYGKGSNVRDWIYVEDHCKALWALFKHGKPGEVYNIGAQNERKNLDVVQLICRYLDELAPMSANKNLTNSAFKSYSDLITFVLDRPGHDLRYAIDPNKVMAEIGWKPEVSFEVGLKMTVSWYLDHSSWAEHILSGEYMQWIKTNYEWRMEEKGQ